MVEIRLATMDDFSQIIDVMNEATLDLLHKGIQQWEYPWDQQKLLNQLKANHLYVVMLDQHMIGAFCIHEIHHINNFVVEEGSKYLSQIAILPKFQGKNMGENIIRFACSIAKKFNKVLYLDCWAGNEKLKQFYMRNGMEYIGDFPEENYLISIFRYS